MQSMKSRGKLRVLRLSIFDLDRTLIRQNSSYAFCRYLHRKKVLSSSNMMFSLFYRFRFWIWNINLTQLHKKAFETLLLGFSLKKLEHYAKAFVKEFLPKEVYIPAYTALRTAQHLGHQTVILSNSPHFLVEPIAEYFKVDEWKATQYGVDKDQTLCNIANLMEGTNKAHYLVKMRKQLDIAKKDVAAYTDSYYDLPLLLEAGTAVVVNPDKKLLKIARQNSWSVI